MKPRTRLQTSTKGDRLKTAGPFRTLSHRILRLANQGMLRSDFQREVAKMIFDFSRCDAVELWVKEHGKNFRCRAKRGRDRSFTCEITALVQPGRGTEDSLRGNQKNLLALCGEILQGHGRSSPPELAPFGSASAVGMVKAGLSLRGKDGTGSSRPSRTRDHDPSLVLIPIRIDRETLGLLLLKRNPGDVFERTEIRRYKELAQTLGIALAHRHAQVDLRERVKELTCLYGIAQRVAEPGLPLEKILQGVVELLPPAWLYPEIANARIVLDGRSYVTPGFQQGDDRLVADILVDETVRGKVEVSYRQEKPELDEGPFYKEERDLLVAVAREIALIIKRKQAEEDQRSLQEQLRHADRLATIGQLAAGVAHELNEPLGGILGFAQLGLKCPGLPDQAAQDIEKILNASLHARDIVKNLLLFARQMPPQRRRTRLNQVVEEGIYFFASRCRKEGVEIVRSLAPDLPEIEADPVLLNQVLVNLVINALQAMPNGGRLTIQTRRHPDGVILRVEDTGAGMTETVRKQIFTPFFTTKDIGQGTGLGLPVVHGIVSSHGGSIHVESSVGRGTKFEIRLPAEMPQTTGKDGRG